jgi:Domain of unknown function (DUF4410)
MKSLCFVVGLVGCVVLSGCAGGHLTATSDTSNPANVGTKLSRPGHICVTPIDITQGTWKAEGSDLTELQAKVKHDLESNLVRELDEIAPTTVGLGDKSSGWQIMVTIVHVDPGSAAMRELVGLGAGQSKINVTFSVNDHGAQSISGHVDADTGAEMGLHSAVIEGNGMDAERIAREIRNYLVNHL